MTAPRRTPLVATLRRPLAALALLAVFGAAQAQAPVATPDLQDIAAAGEVVIGVREDALPFAFVDQDGKPKGYAVDICTRIVERLRTTLNRPDLRVRFNTLTVSTRTLLVREKVVDLECGNTSITRERAADFDFSLAYGVEQAQLISLASEPVDLAQLARGARVMVTSGSSSAVWLAAQNGGGRAKAELVPVRNAGRAYYELTDRKEHAYVGSGEVFVGEVLRRGGKATDFRRVTLDSGAEPLAVMMRKDRPGLKQAADDTIRALAQSGELAQLYSKWFESPIAARRASLGQPMSTAWAAMLKSPTDQPLN